MSNKCPICNKEGINKNIVSTQIKIYCCDICNLHYLDTWDQPDEVKKLYDKSKYVFRPNITGQNMKYDEYKERVKRIKPYTNNNSRLLDIGCGDGTFMKMIRPFVKEVKGTEITKAQVKKLREQKYKIWDVPLQEIKPSEPFDIICLFALLEHVPNVTDFLIDLKSRFTHEKTQIFIEVPNLMEPLANCYDIPQYRDFFYRDIHLYYFSESSLKKLLEKIGFDCETHPILQASITNHFHWMHNCHGQKNTTEMSNVVLPRKPLMTKTPKGNDFIKILDKVDDYYKELMTNDGIGDLITCRCWLK